MVRALDRLSEIVGLGGVVEVSDVPPVRVEALGRQGLATDVWALRRMPEPRRTAMLLATARALEASAVDDALDLFAVLMATKLVAPAPPRAADPSTVTAPGNAQ
jgi:hypothetical protein